MQTLDRSCPAQWHQIPPASAELPQQALTTFQRANTLTISCIFLFWQDTSNHQSRCENWVWIISLTIYQLITPIHCAYSENLPDKNTCHTCLRQKLTQQAKFCKIHQIILAKICAQNTQLVIFWFFWLLCKADFAHTQYSCHLLVLHSYWRTAWIWWPWILVACHTAFSAVSHHS